MDMEKTLINQLSLIKEKYERLHFTDSVVYADVVGILTDPEKIEQISSNLSKIICGEKIFNVVGKISSKLQEKKNNEVVLSSFAEYDTGRWLVTGFIEGKYEEIRYIPRSNTSKLPDFSVKLGETTIPVETKIIFPDSKDEEKTLNRILERVNNSAIPQLQAFSSEVPFKKAKVFIWTHEPITFNTFTYGQLENIFIDQIKKRPFALQILFIVYRQGLWDFNI